MGLCSFGVVAGLIMRFTHRYKFLQLTGLSIKIIGYGLLVDKSGVRSLARLTMAQLLTGMGGAFSVVGSQVSSQGSVPHQDVALVIALLSLWTNIGASIGSAIASAVWTNAMPTNLRNFVPASVNDTEVMEMFASSKFRSASHNFMQVILTFIRHQSLSSRLCLTIPPFERAQSEHTKPRSILSGLEL